MAEFKPIIEDISIEFIDPKSEPEIPITLFEDTEYQFGIFKVKVRGDIPITNKHLHIFFTVDNSGSMSDICSDGRTKLQHLLHTLENMLRMFHEISDANISIHVQTFADDIHDIITNVANIHIDDMEAIIYKIKKIRTSGSTNIEAALKSYQSHVESYKANTSNSNHELVHIFLTDGEITIGETNNEKLVELVPTDSTNIFVGYGIGHDSQLLSYFGNAPNNDYRFIDAIEKASLVYGEIVHGLLYKAVESVILKTNNCEIYNYLTNEWSSELYIGNLLSEQNKIYHIRSKTPLASSIQIQGIELTTPNKELAVTSEFQPQNSKQLNFYILRQRCQELLYEARKLSERFKLFHNNNDILLKDPNYFDNDNEDKHQFKAKLKQYLELLIAYGKTNNLESDPYLKMICDDIYVAYRTLGTRYANMYTCSRQTSQGRQQVYTCSILNDIEEDINLNIINNSLRDYTMSNDVLSPFSTDTPRVVDVMREISAGDDFNELTMTNRI
jgi:uncharacterized protein YegL